MGSLLTETCSADDVFAWLNSNGFEEVSQSFYGMYCCDKNPSHCINCRNSCHIITFIHCMVLVLLVV